MRTVASTVRSNRVPVLVMALALLFTPLLNNTPAEGISPGVDVVYVAEGTNYADALVGAALAAANNTAVLTVAGTKSGDLVPQSTKDELTRLKPKSIVVLGGVAAISQKVEDELATYTDPPGSTSRLEGVDRFDTAAKISEAMPDAVRKAVFALTAGDADTLDGKDSGAFALSGTSCAAGQVVTGIAADGAPTCAADDVDGGDAATLNGLGAGQLTPFAAATEVAGALTTSSPTYVDLEPVTVDITVPAGRTAILVAHFTAESTCSGSTGWCAVRVLVDGAEMQPGRSEGFVAMEQAFDSSDNNTETGSSYESHAIVRVSEPLTAGTYTIQVQAGVSNSALSFRLDDWILTGEAKLVG